MALTGWELRDPVPRDVDPAADPDTLVALDMLDEADQRLGAAGMASEPHMEADRHHPRPLRSLLVQQIEAVAQIGEEILARTERAAAELHVVGGQRVGDDEVRLGGPRA